MRIAFYAPMKAPTDEVPSGDREMARLLWNALAKAGHELALASRFRSWEGRGDRERQQRLRHVGERLGQRLLQRYRAQSSAQRPHLWFTYHLYHRAPDWLGPAVSRGLGIPYVVAEASYAPKQAGGPWASGHQAVADALAHADAVIALNSNDIACVRALLHAPQRLIHLKPFVDTAAYRANGARLACHARVARRFGLRREVPWLLAVGMMRHGDKLASYRLLAEALQALVHLPWTLLIVGDGPARAQVQAAFDALGAERVVFAGLQQQAALAELYAACDLFVWPAINEAYGMALLEAQAAGLGVVAGRTGGVGDIVRDSVSGLLVRPADASAFAAALTSVLADRERMRQMGAAAARLAQDEHDIAGARDVLTQALCALRAPS